MVVEKDIFKNNKNFVCVIGGTNIDIIGRPNGILLPKTSNIGEINMNLGGVARNISHNLHNLGVKNTLITAIGKDMYGEKILSECQRIGLNLEDSLVIDEEASGVYLSILDEDGELMIALSQMDIFDRLTPDYIEEKAEIVNKANAIVVDTNIPRMSIEYILYIANKDKIPVFIDTVSIVKAEKVKDIIGGFHTIKPNLLELELLTDRKVETVKDIQLAAEVLLSKGVKEVIVSLGKEGALYNNGKEWDIVEGFDVKVKNTTGAGDAFLAGLVYGTLLGKNLREKVIYALGCGAITVESYATVSDKLNADSLHKLTKTINDEGI